MMYNKHVYSTHVVFEFHYLGVPYAYLYASKVDDGTELMFWQKYGNKTPIMGKFHPNRSLTASHAVMYRIVRAVANDL